MDRREFLTLATGAVAGAVAGAALTAAFTLPAREGAIAPRAAAGGFPGARHLGGPARSGLPYVPLTVREGVLAVRPSVPWGGRMVDALAWHRYCGFDAAPGLDPSWRGTDKVSYHDPYRDEDDPRVEPVWWADRHGEFVRPDDLDPGQSILFRWRSAADDPNPLVGLLLRVPPGEIRHEHPRPRGSPNGGGRGSGS